MGLTTLRRRAGVLWDLYRPVRGLALVYAALVVVGTVLEGFALAAIVPLIGGNAGAVSDFYESLLRTVGLDPASTTALVVVVGVLFTLRSAAQYGTTLLAGVMVRREAVRLQVELISLYLNLRWEEQVKLPQGEVNLLLSGHVQQVGVFLKRFMSLVEGSIYTIGLTVIAIWVSPQNTLLAAGLIGVSGVGVGIVANRIRRYAYEVLSTSKAQAGLILQYARGAPILRAYDVTSDAVAEVEQLATRREQLAYRAARISSLGKVLPDLAFVLALLVVVGLAARRGDTLAEVGAIVALLFRVSQYLKRFADVAALSNMLPAVRNVQTARGQFANRPAPRLEHLWDEALPPGTIAVEGASYRYGRSKTAALEDVTLRVEPGQFVGVVGSSGSGKSTLIQILAGLLQPTEGTAHVGLRASPDDRTRRVGYVPQTPFLLKGTIASNVRWFRAVDDAAIVAACDAAGLGGMLARLPAGIDTEVGQEGLSLSGGERQRLALARALAGDPDILLLDEATSALDSESEAAIQRALVGMRGRVTIIAVAHRLSTVLDADRIWVVERGRVTEDASPAELLGEEGSRFAQLSALQGISGRSDVG